MHYDSVEKLHTILNRFAPNGIVQCTIVQARNEAEADLRKQDLTDYQYEKELVKVLTSILTDGLHYGNWPR